MTPAKIRLQVFWWGEVQQIASRDSTHLQWKTVPPQDLQVWLLAVMPLKKGVALFSQSGQLMAPVDRRTTGLPLPPEPPVFTQTVWHFEQATAAVGDWDWQELRRAVTPRLPTRRSVLICVFMCLVVGYRQESCLHRDKHLSFSKPLKRPRNAPSTPILTQASSSLSRLLSICLAR